MTSLGRIAVYTLLFLLLGAVLYFFAFWRPNVNRIEQLNREIRAAQIGLEEASRRGAYHSQLLLDVARLNSELYHEERAYERANNEWNSGYLHFLPTFFDDADIMQRVSRIVSPYSERLDVDFMYSQPLGTMRYNEGYHNGLPEGVWLTPVNVSFFTNYDGIIAILNGFAHEGIDARVVDYSLSRQGNMWDVSVQLDILTQTPSYRHNGDYEVAGE